MHATVSALGLAVILASSALAYTVLKLAGAAYLIWLGVHALRRAAGSELETIDAPRPAPGSPFVRGFLSNVLNPKVALFYLTFLPQFISPSGSVLGQSLLLAGIHAIEGLAWLALYVLVLERLTRRVRTGRLRRGLEGLSGLVLVGLGLRVATESR